MLTDNIQPVDITFRKQNLPVISYNILVSET